MHRYEIGKRLSPEQTATAIARLEAYAHEWSDHEAFGEDGDKIQRVVDSLTAFLRTHRALPAPDSLTHEECDAMLLSDARDVAG